MKRIASIIVSAVIGLMGIAWICGIMMSCSCSCSVAVFSYSEEDGGYYVAKGHNVREVVIPSKHMGKPVIGVKGGAFGNMDKIEKVIISEGVQEIGDLAFYGCDNIEEIQLNEGLKYIGERVFYKHYSSFGPNESIPLEINKIPESVIDIGDSAFGWSVENIEYENGVYYLDGWVCDYDSQQEIVELREGTRGIMGEVFGYSVETSAGFYQKYNSKLKEIYFNDELQAISRYAFGFCSGLTSIQLPEGLEYIGPGAFRSCNKLSEIAIPEGVYEIGEEAFSDCKNLSEIVLNEKIKVLKNRVFKGCEKLVDIVLPENVRSLQDGVFRDCKNLVSIEGTENLTHMGHRAFSGCESLTNIELADNVKLGTGAFSGCGLTSFEYPLGCNVVPVSCFEGCKDLVSIELHDGITEIGYEAFKNCTNLTSIDIPIKVETISYNMFENCTELSNVELSENTKVIGENSFYNCKALTSINFPFKVDLIYKGAFKGSGLQSVTFENPYGWFFCDSADSEGGTKISVKEMEDSTRASEIFISKMNSKHFKRSAK